MRLGRAFVSVTFVATLLGLGLANIALRATWDEVEDGVLWVARPDGVTAAEIASGSPAEAAGLRRGDVLLAIGDRPVQTPDEVLSHIHRQRPGTRLRYTVLRLESQQVLSVALAPLSQGASALYFVLAGIGVFTLLVGAGVRFKRPGDEATLHFFWLCLAFFGAITFSFNGRLDRLDWFFYWADAVSILLLPPLFLHFTLVFPERPRSWVRSPIGRSLLPLIYAPAAVLGGIRVFAIARAPVDARYFTGIVATLDRLEPLYLSLCLVSGLAILVHAFSHVRSVTARRQLRWIVWGTALGAVPFALGYAVPYAFGVDPTLPMELSAVPLSLVPLAFASAIVRYRLMDVEIIVKRLLVWSVAVAAIVGLYVVLLRVATEGLSGGAQNWVTAGLATLVVMLLANPVKNAIQTALDRAFYRDRFDYRRALVGFARDLNSDLDLARLAERLTTRVMETFGVDRMVLFMADEAAGDFAPLHAAGFAIQPPELARRSGLGGRLEAGHAIALDDPLSARRFSEEELEFWRDWGLFYFVPCVAKEGTIAILALGRRESAEPLSSEDLALLAAVAGQAATALENGRLYRQLHLKAVELDRLREFSDNILHSLNSGLVVIDTGHRVRWWNRAIERLYGVPAADAVGRTLREIFDARFVDAVTAALRDHPDGTTLSRVPLVSRHAPDDRLLVNVGVTPLREHRDGQVETAGSVLIFEDITARVELEKQLQISEKMASIGMLAAGVAHEVNTPLTGIASFTQMLLEGADPADPRTQLLEKIERQTFRAAKIVNGLLTLSRQGAAGLSDRAPVDVNAVIGDVLGLVEHQLEAANIRIRRELAPSALVVDGIEHKLQQVFLNLFLNARDAMPRGGWLSVTTRREEGSVIAEVADTGSGIPAEHLARIYDPFFTTKPIGHGTGLGLSIAYGIVREHDGTINVESHLGQGTRFTLTLPASQSFGQPARRAER